jgi:hypothetical protein
MDVYEVWCDAKTGVGDIAFSEAVSAYLGYLKAQGLIEGWRLLRRKLGLGPPSLGEYQLMIEIKNLEQLDQAFEKIAARRDPVESLHHGLNRLVENAVFALYRDFPDQFRQRGEEKF